MPTVCAVLITDLKQKTKKLYQNTPCTSLRYLYPRSLFNIHVYLCAIYVPGHSLMPTVCAVLITDLKQKTKELYQNTPCTSLRYLYPRSLFNVHVYLCAIYVPGHSSMPMHSLRSFWLLDSCCFLTWTVPVYNWHNFWSSNRFSDPSCTSTHHNWPQFLIVEQVF